jgi:DNA replication and repair protein RecF
VYLKALSITHFKNYGAVSLGFSSSLNFITGKNGTGKTNLLDGIYYLCLGKSYFHASDQQSVKLEERFFRMEGAFVHGSEPINIRCVYPLGGKKELSCNEVTCQRLTDHVGTIPVVMIAPDDQSLINEGSDERRRFIDNTISQIDHLYLEDLLLYNKVLQQRNAALKNFAVTKRFDAALMEVIRPTAIRFWRKNF